VRKNFEFDSDQKGTLYRIAAALLDVRFTPEAVSFSTTTMFALWQKRTMLN
jgi:hypothetical protein